MWLHNERYERSILSDYSSKKFGLIRMRYEMCASMVDEMSSKIFTSVIGQYLSIYPIAP